MILSKFTVCTVCLNACDCMCNMYLVLFWFNLVYFIFGYIALLKKLNDEICLKYSFHFFLILSQITDKRNVNKIKSFYIEKILNIINLNVKYIRVISKY